MLRLWESVKKYQASHRSLYRLSIVVLFWALADGIASFAFPVYLKQTLGSLALVGLVFASSSIFGLLTDFYFGSEQKGRSFKPYFFLSIFFAAVAYLIALKAKSVFVFLSIMALWGIYYELINFGIVDFLAHFAQKFERAQSAGVVQMFNSLGYLIAPLIAGASVLENRQAMHPALFFMFLSLTAFLLWFGRKKIVPEPPRKKLTSRQELKIWLGAGRRAAWVITAMFLINLWDAVIWSMGPILLTGVLNESAAIVMACFSVPRVFLQGYAGRWADKKGKKEIMLLGLFLAGVFLSLFSLSDMLFYKIITALMTAVGAALVWPSAGGLFIDMIDGYKDQEEEVTGLWGLAHNLAYIVGPVLAGLLGMTVGLPATFLIAGLFLISGAVLIKTLWR